MLAGNPGRDMSARYANPLTEPDRHDRAYSGGSASFLLWQAPPRSVTGRRTTVIAAMGESSAVAGPAGRYLLRSTVRTLPMAKSVALLAASESIGRT